MAFKKKMLGVKAGCDRFVTCHIFKGTGYEPVTPPTNKHYLESDNSFLLFWRLLHALGDEFLNAEIADLPREFDFIACPSAFVFNANRTFHHFGEADFIAIDFAFCDGRVAELRIHSPAGHSVAFDIKVVNVIHPANWCFNRRRPTFRDFCVTGTLALALAEEEQSGNMTCAVWNRLRRQLAKSCPPSLKTQKLRMPYLLMIAIIFCPFFSAMSVSPSDI